MGFKCSMCYILVNVKTRCEDRETFGCALTTLFQATHVMRIFSH